MIYGLTGGIASGKSTVAAMFKELGANIVDADKISREVVNPGTKGANLIRKYFGDELFALDGSLRRDKLAEVIFSDIDARKQLNQILHPLIMEEMKSQTIQFQKEDADGKPIIWDIPLLYEENLTHKVQKVIVVYVPEQLQLVRLMTRNNLNQADAHARIQAQLSIEEKKSLADFLIDNSGTLEQTKRQVVALWNHLI